MQRGGECYSPPFLWRYLRFKVSRSLFKLLRMHKFFCSQPANIKTQAANNYSQAKNICS